MAMGHEGDRQGDLMVTWAEMPRSPGHVFYDRLQEVLIAGGFDRFVETACQPCYAARMGAPSVPPGRYFRLHRVGHFEGIASERGIAWRCSGSLALRDFLRLESREKIPDHSGLSKTRGRLPHEVHETVFGWVLKCVAERGLVQGRRIGIEASTMEADAALRTIVRREDGRTYREMLTPMARESGIATPTADGLVRIGRARKDKTLSNAEWTSKTDPEARIARLKDGRTHLAYQPEHAIDLDTGIIVAATIHPADHGDTTTIAGTLMATQENLAQSGAAPTTDPPSERVADKGYHARALLKNRDGGVGKTRIVEPRPPGFSRWHGDEEARRAVYANRTRLCSGVGKPAMRRRAEIVERSFAPTLDRGGRRRTGLRGRDNVPKRSLIHLAGHNLGILCGG
ncbi:MAG: transposase [Stellaceae bacterium]